MASGKQYKQLTRVETQHIRYASPQQREILEYGPAPLCVSGGFGASKTWGCVMKALLVSSLFPENRGVIFRKRFTELRDTTMSTFYKIVPPAAYRYGGRRNDQEKYLRLNNGSEVLFMHLDDPDIANVIKGLEINWFFGDQAEEIPEEIVDKLMSRLGRWDKTIVPQEMIDREASAGRQWAWHDPFGKPIPPTYALLACNPDTKLHYLYRRYHPDSPEHWELRPDGQGGQTSYHLEGYKMLNMHSFDNIFLTNQNRAHLVSQDESFQRRYVRGEWGIPEGQIHSVTEASKIRGTRELISYLLRTCTLHRSMDHGDTAPTCIAWWAVDKDGNIFLFAEYYHGNRLISQHRKEARAIDVELGMMVGKPQGLNYTFQLADPSIFDKINQKKGGKFSIADDYLDDELSTREDIIVWESADNNELVTRARINEYLAVDPDRINPITKEKGSPRLFFIKKSDEWPYGAARTISQTESQMKVKIGTEMGTPVYSDDRDENITDHGYDPVRYFVASRPPVAEVLQPRSTPNTFASVRHNLIQFRKRGGFDRLARMVQMRTRQRGY